MSTHLVSLDGMTPETFRSIRRLQTGLDMLFSELAAFTHVNELDPVTRELFRDLRGTLSGFMTGVS